MTYSKEVAVSEDEGDFICIHTPDSRQPKKYRDFPEKEETLPKRPCLLRFTIVNRVDKDNLTASSLVIVFRRDTDIFPKGMMGSLVSDSPRKRAYLLAKITRVERKTYWILRVSAPTQSEYYMASSSLGRNSFLDFLSCGFTPFHTLLIIDYLIEDIATVGAF